MKVNFRKAIILILLVLSSVLVSLGMAETEISIFVGESLQLSSKVFLEGKYADSRYITWTSSDASIASVGSNGSVTGKAEGIAYIKAVLNEGTHIKEATVSIQVKSTVKGVRLTNKISSLKVGESFVLNAEVQPVDNLDATLNKGITWISMDAAILTVDSSGKAYGKAPGKAIILVKTVDGKKQDYVEITVESTVEKIEFATKEVEIYIGGEQTLEPVVLPETAYLKDVTWTSLHGNIVSVDSNGKIKGIKEGEGYVGAATVDGNRSAYVKVKVKSSLDGIKLSDSRVELTDDNKTYELKVEYIQKFETVEPVEKGLTWSSSNSAIASVDSNGVVTGKKTGYAEIVAVSKDGGYRVGCIFDVKITPPKDNRVFPNNLILRNTPATCYVGEEVPLDITIYPITVTEKGISMVGATSGTYEFINREGKYYFKPLRSLAYTMTLRTVNGMQEQFTIVAKPTVARIEILPGELEKDGDSYVQYLGQTNLFSYKLHPLPGLTDADIKVRTVTWTGTDGKNKSARNDYNGEAFNITKARLTVKSDDGNAYDSIEVDLRGMLKTIEVDENVKIGLRYEYEPWIKFIPEDNLMYGLKEVLDKEYTMTIEKTYISDVFLNAEKAYEENKVKELNELVQKRVNLKENLEKLQRHESRVKALEYFLEKSSDGFSLISNDDNILLTDRDGKELKVSEVISNKFIGYFVSKSEILIKTKDNNVQKKATVVVDDKTSELVIMDALGRVISISDREAAEKIRKDQDELAKQLEAEAKRNEELAAAKKLAEAKEKYAGKSLVDTPSEWAIVLVEDASGKELVIDEIRMDFRRHITREEFATLAVRLYEKLTDKKTKAFQSDYFVDTNNIEVIKAYNLGIVNGIGSRTFAPDKLVSRQEMCVMLMKTLKASGMELEVKSDKNVFSDMNDVASWAKESVEALSVNHNIVSGVGENKLGVLENATREQAIILVLRLFDELK